MDFNNYVSQNDNAKINVRNKFKLNLLISLKKFMNQYVSKVDIGYIYEKFQKVKCRNGMYQ